MLSAVKLLKSVSMSGPSAIEKPISAKISVISSATWLTGWMRPSASGAFAHRQGDVGALSREPRAQRRAAKRLALGFQRLADALFELVDGLAEALALFRRHAPERLHQLRDAALLAERGDAHLFQRAEVCRLGDSAKQLALDPLERSSLSRGRLGHGGLKLKPWPQLTRPRPGSGRLLARARRYRQAPCGRARCRPCSGRR